MTKNELEVASVQMFQAGLRTQETLQVFVSADGTRRYAGIWSTADGEAQSRPVMEPPKTGSYEVHWEDISVAGPGKPPHPLDVLRDRLTLLTQLPPPEQESSERLERAKVHYYLDQPEDALVELDPLLADPSLPSEARCCTRIMPVSWARRKRPRKRLRNYRTQQNTPQSDRL